MVDISLSKSTANVHHLGLRVLLGFVLLYIAIFAVNLIMGIGPNLLLRWLGVSPNIRAFVGSTFSYRVRIAALCVLPRQEVTPTPEVFIPLDRAIPDDGIVLEGIHLHIANATLNRSFPAGCTGEAPACTQAQNGDKILSVTFQPRDLPEGQMLAYKNLPDVSVTVKGGETVLHSLFKYDNVTHILTLGFEVPENASAFGLKWADLTEIPLNVAP
jgi:hypothetical protein